MKSMILALSAVLIAAGTPAQAQFSGLANKLGGGSASKADADAVVKSGLGIAAFSAAASDLAVDAALQMLQAFPDSKVAAIKSKFMKYNELKAAGRKDGALDANAVTLASDGFKEMEKLDPKGYEKAKASVVRPAYAKLGLALLADGAAAAQIPTFTKASSEAISSLGSNPMQAGKLVQLKNTAATVSVLSKAIPEQVKSMETVRTIAKKIAEAEQIKLGDPKVAFTSLDPKVLADSVKTVDIDG